MTRYSGQQRFGKESTLPFHLTGLSQEHCMTAQGRLGNCIHSVFHRLGNVMCHQALRDEGGAPENMDQEKYSVILWLMQRRQ
jgi:hypothetical protein